MPRRYTPAADGEGHSIGPDLTACPSDIDLACFVDGLLDEHAHHALLRHLDACDDCRDVVATAVEALRDPAGQSVALDVAAPGPDDPSKKPS